VQSGHWVTLAWAVYLKVMNPQSVLSVHVRTDQMIFTRDPLRCGDIVLRWASTGSSQPYMQPGFSVGEDLSTVQSMHACAE
jgi:hypothetical protein